MLIRTSTAVPLTHNFLEIPDPFLQDVMAGLRQPQKTLPPKYFYDVEGSRLFDHICRLEEYYPYRTELAMLPGVAEDVRKLFSPAQEKGLTVVEFGAGSLYKIRLLVDGIPYLKTYIPIDISGEHLNMSAADLGRRYPHLSVHPIEADFTEPVSLLHKKQLLMGFFPGSTIGNLMPDAAVEFLRHARSSLGNNGYLLIGVDTKKDPRILHCAYNDQVGITARFNKNILKRINRDLGADFDVSKFEHDAWYNRALGRVEMHLRSRCAQKVVIGDEAFCFRAGETIHTENSFKYHPEEFSCLAAKAGWITIKEWMAVDNMFSMFLLKSPQ